jgi:hypothetical protein
MLRAEATRAQRLFAAAGWLVLEVAVAAGAAVLLLEVCWLCWMLARRLPIPQRRQRLAASEGAA